MKVLINKFKKKRLKRCPHCKSLLLVGITDCDKHGGLLEVIYKYECPLCGNTNTFSRY